VPHGSALAEGRSRAAGAPRIDQRGKIPGPAQLKRPPEGQSSVAGATRLDQRGKNPAKVPHGSALAEGRSRAAGAPRIDQRFSVNKEDIAPFIVSEIEN
jgi:hypothetical protein